MAWLPSMPEPDRVLADRINNEALANPSSPYAGKFVRIANGQIVATSKDLDEVCKAMDTIEPDSAKHCIFEAGIDYDKVEYIGLGDSSLPPERDEWAKISRAFRGLD